MNTNFDILKYKDYTASITYNRDDQIFVGEVLNTTDLLSFHGATFDELEKSFQDCIENYLSLCAQINKVLEKRSEEFV